MNQFQNFEIIMGTTRDDRMRRKAVIEQYVNQIHKYSSSSGHILTPAEYVRIRYQEWSSEQVP